MAVMIPREKWTDDRLDDLNKKIDDGFARVEGEIKRLDGDIKRLDGNVSELGREMNARFEGLYRTLQAGTAAVIVALIGSNAF
jgi:archaellum component FlaC